MSKMNKALRRAVERGLYVKDGITYGIRGKRKTAIKTINNYTKETVNVGYKGTSVPISVARIIAYQKYGDKLFQDGIVVRHLDGNGLNNSKDNIFIGSMHDNMMDIPQEERMVHGKRAASFLRKYSNEVESSICKSYKSGLGYKRLSKRYDIPTSTIRSILIRRGCFS